MYQYGNLKPGFIPSNESYSSFANNYYRHSQVGVMHIGLKTSAGSLTNVKFVNPTLAMLKNMPNTVKLAPRSSDK